MEDNKKLNASQNEANSTGNDSVSNDEVVLTGIWSILYYVSFAIIFLGICIAVEYIAQAAGVKSSQFDSKTYDAAGIIILFGEKMRLKKLFLALSQKLKQTDTFSIDIAIGAIFGIAAFFLMIYFNLSTLRWNDFLAALLALGLYYLIPFIFALIAQSLRKK